MKTGIKIALVFIAFIFYSCQNEIPMVNLGIDDIYVVERMKKVILTPEFSGEKYIWSMKDSSGNDSIISTERNYIFIAEIPGEYYINFKIIDSQNPIEQNIRFVVWEEQIAYSRYIQKVYDYCPAPGQFINVLPIYEKGNTEEDMRRKVEECISGKNDIMVSLGGYGGYVTFGFDHTVVNIPGEYDFKILGNAFYASNNPNLSSREDAGSSEPGIVMVSLDRNGNGIPDDEWYELAGSEYTKPETIKNYLITYYKPDENKIKTPDKDYPFLNDTTYIKWESNHNDYGYISRNTYHNQPYYPQWIKEDKIILQGTKLANNYKDESGNGSLYIQYPYEWGYVDNHPNEVQDKSSFNIEWAVDKDGNKVYLPGVDFIRVYTGVNQYCGWLGETSTELLRAEDLHIKDATNYYQNP